MKNISMISVIVILATILGNQPVEAAPLNGQVNAAFPAGATIFVDINNNSGIEDGTDTHPFNTIQEGINVAATGDLVGVAPGTYFERLTVRAGIQLVGTDPAMTIIDGGLSGTVVKLENASLLKSFTIQHGRASFGGGIVTIGAPTIAGNIIRDNAQTSGGAGAAIHGNNSSPIVVGNLITGNTADTQWLSGAVSFINTSSPYIANNIITNNSGRGAINLTMPAGNYPTILNNTIHSNDGAGVKIDARVDQTTVTVGNNVISNNTTGVLIDFPGANAYIPVMFHNDVYGNTRNFVGLSDFTGTNGNISVAPAFLDSFHLNPTSQLIDAGNSTTFAATDFDGQARPIDGNGDGLSLPDIGADEANPSVHVGLLTGKASKSRQNWQATVNITIHNGNHEPTPGAIVTGNWSGELSGGSSCTTDQSGICTVTTGMMLANMKTVTFTIVSVEKAGFEYLAFTNEISSITINMTKAR